MVCSTRVDKHYKTIKPSVEAGKDVYVEWPLGANVHQADELTSLANEKGAKTIIGLQGRLSPICLRMKEILESGQIGKVLSSSVTASSGRSLGSISEDLAFFYDRSVGCNLLTIMFAHLIDSILNVLGPMKSITPHLSLQRPEISVLSSSTGQVSGVVQSNVPDLINVHGILTSQGSAPISILYRAGPAFKGTPSLIWSIVGEKGEIRVEGEGPHLHASSKGFKVLLQPTGSEDVESIEWKNEMEERGFQGPAANIGSLYEAFANGQRGSWPGFEQALECHRMLEEVWDDWHA